MRKTKRNLLKKILLGIGIGMFGGILFIFIWGWIHMKNRHPGYERDLLISPSEKVEPLKAGFAKRSITPMIVDTWIDSNNDSRYNPGDGDTYLDNNENGRFDAYWMAGFHNARPANGVHDPIWARTMVINDGKTRFGLVALDIIGLGHDHVIETRKRIAERVDMDYTLICSTHNHEAPDLIGLWGKSRLKSGIDKNYMEFVQTQIAKCVELAVQNLRPAKLRLAQDLDGAQALVTDTRKPYVFDPGLRLIQAVDFFTDEPLGVLVTWGNHPETLWSQNLMISSDFPHYLRKGIEEGIHRGNQTFMEGLGGVAVYANGAIGGLMTTDPQHPVKDPVGKKVYLNPSFKKARALGEQLALLCLKTLKRDDLREIKKGSIGLRAKTVSLPVNNRNFQLASFLGVLDRGFTGWMNLRTEVVGVTLGSVSFMGVPGEIYPELVNGGIQAPQGRDFSTQPLEIPPFRELMPGKYRFVIGLANDEIGYIIPKSEWDIKEPFLYQKQESPYGEELSLGPDTSSILHKAYVNLWNNLLPQSKRLK